MTANYKLIEELLLRSILLLKMVFSDSEQQEIKDFLDAGEYGLALETLVNIVVEENKSVPNEAYDLIKQLAGLMSLEEKVLTRELLDRVSAE